MLDVPFAGLRFPQLRLRLHRQRSVAQLPVQREVEAAKIWRDWESGVHAAWSFAALTLPCADDREW